MVSRIRSLLLTTGEAVCALCRSPAAVLETRSGCRTLVSGPPLAHARGKGPLFLAWLCIRGSPVWVHSGMWVCYTVGKNRCRPSNGGNVATHSLRNALSEHPISVTWSQVNQFLKPLPIREASLRLQLSCRSTRTPLTMSAWLARMLSIIAGRSAGLFCPSPPL